MVITGTGGTDNYPLASSIPETAFVTVLVFLGALLWTQVLALFCDVATNSNPAETLFRQTLDDLNTFVEVLALCLALYLTSPEPCLLSPACCPLPAPASHQH